MFRHALGYFFFFTSCGWCPLALANFSLESLGNNDFNIADRLVWKHLLFHRQWHDGFTGIFFPLLLALYSEEYTVQDGSSTFPQVTTKLCCGACILYWLFLTILKLHVLEFLFLLAYVVSRLLALVKWTSFIPHIIWLGNDTQNVGLG